MKRVILVLALLTWGGSVAAATAQQDVRSNILTSALSTFAKQGFFECSMASIAEDAGVSAATLESYFASKDVLIQELLVQVEAEMIKALMPAYQQKGTYRERYTAFFTALSHYLIEHPEARRYLDGFYASPMGDDKARQEAADPELLRNDPFFNVINEGFQQGLFKDTLTLEEACDVILSALVTLSQHASVVTANDNRVRQWVDATWDAVTKH